MSRFPFSSIAAGMLGLVFCVGQASVAHAQTAVPGPADVGRVKPVLPPTGPDHSHDRDIAVPEASPLLPVPETAKQVRFTLQSVAIEGATVFKPPMLKDIYERYIHREISLDTVYQMAADITARYRGAGYFLSLARVPNQHIHDGAVRIDIIEGYIADVEIPEEFRGSFIVKSYTSRLTAQKPAKADVVESVLLRLNDLPGVSFRSVLSPVEGRSDGAVKLTLVAMKKDNKGTLSFDNYSSRYLGAHEVSASYSASLLPMQQTTLSGLMAVPESNLRYGFLDHRAMLAPDLTLDLNGGLTQAWPGFTLKPEDIKSHTATAGFGLNYQLLRQREQNLSFRIEFAGSNVDTELLGSSLTRDRVRVTRAGASYDATDSWAGYNIVNVTVSQGLPAFGASHKNDPELSRAGAPPYFTKTELSLSRLQQITDDWSIYGASSGQWSSGTLYASEQFGYGGQAFGRAYDASDITGDRGISGSLELRYDGWSRQGFSFQPYSFWDIGAVWSVAPGSEEGVSGSSAGFGMRFNTPWNQSGNLGLAWPLTRAITAPTYNVLPQGPRITLQVSQQF